MKKFTKVLEELNTNKFYKTYAKVELIIESENEGEAGYKSDSILASIENIYNYEIQLIEETNDKIVENMELYTGKNMSEPDDPNNATVKEKIESMWIAEFGDRTPTATEKLEWYHQMRLHGYDGIQIFKVLGNRF